MKRFFSEKNFAAALFVFALIFFVFAQQDAKKVEKMYRTNAPDISTLTPASKNTAANITVEPNPKVITSFQSR